MRSVERGVRNPPRYLGGYEQGGLRRMNVRVTLWKLAVNSRPVRLLFA